MPLTKDFKINEVVIEKYRATNQDIQSYILEQQSIIAADPSNNLTFSEYLQQKYFPDERFPGKKIVVVADLSNKIFKKENFSAGDFSGSIIKNTSFIGCNLLNSVFCDVDFDNAYFNNSKLKNIDLRGAALENCKFDENYKNYSNLAIADEIKGIKFSTTSSLGRIYADIKSEATRTIERQDLIVQKTLEVNEAYKNISWQETAWLNAARATGNEKYDTLSEQLKLMTEKKIFPGKDYILHATFQHVFSSTSGTFDPAYVRGSSKAERDRETQYVPLTKEDVINYLVAIKTEKGLSLNDFAARRPGIAFKEGARIIADCSSKVETFGNNQWKNRVDLSNLDFTGANLEGSVFAGSLLENCKFIDSNISKASFEGAVLDHATFLNVNANNTNFFNTALGQSDIKNSKFQHAYMARSQAEEIIVGTSNFDYANIREGKWNHAKLTDSTFNYADLEGISLISASLKKINMQQAILNKAILSECSVIESNFSLSLMSNVKAEKIKFETTILNQIEANGIDLSEAELDRFSKLEGANLTEAILKKINAVGVSFKNANLNYVQADLANLSQAILEGATATYANFKEAILTEAKAKNINISYSNLEKVEAVKIDLENAVARYITAEKANFTEGVFSGIDLTRSNLMAAILVKVQAEQAKLIDVNLREAKLAEANLDLATVNDRTNIAHADILGAKGDFITEDKQLVSIKNHKMELEKLELEQSSKELSWPQRLAAIASDGARALRPTASSIPAVISLVSNFNNLQEVNAKLSNVRLLAEERQQLQEKQNSYVLELIKDAEPVLENFLPLLKEGNLSNLTQDRITKIVLPIINSILLPIIMPMTASKTTANLQTPNLFNNVSSKFSRRLITIGANLSSSILAGESNPKVQKIYINLQNIQDDSLNNIVTGVTEILNTPRAQEIITKDLVLFLTDIDNQKNLVTIAENAFDDKITRFASKELFSNTVSTAIDITAIILQNIPAATRAYNSYISYLNVGEKFLKEDLPVTTELLLLAQQKLNISEIVTNTAAIVKNMTPVLGTNLPKYLENNKTRILKFLADPEVIKNIKSTGADYSLIYEATEAVTPFLVDLLPIFITVSRDCLEKTEELTTFILQTQEVIKEPAGSKLANEKLDELVTSLIAFKNSNPEVKKAIEEILPTLMKKHAHALGPVIEKILKQSVIGKKFQLKGKAIVEAFSRRIPELTDIGILYQKGNYIAMVPSVLKVLANRQVLGLLVRGAGNYTTHQIQKYLVPNKIRDNSIGLELNNIVTDITELPSTLAKQAKPDLATLLHDKYEEQSVNKRASLPLSYSLRTGDLSGISFKDTKLNLQEFKIKDINFNDAKLYDCSFKGSILDECSFSGTVFNEPTNFTDATIDANTLSTLLPAIEKYNQKHPERQLILDNIKIIGDISKLDFSKVQLNNPILEEAIINITAKNGQVYNTNFGVNAIPEKKLSQIQEISKTFGVHGFKKGESEKKLFNSTVIEKTLKKLSMNKEQ